MSTNFPTAGGPVQGSNAGSENAFLSKITPSVVPPVITAISLDTGPFSSDLIATDQNLTLSGTANPSPIIREIGGEIGLTSVFG